MEKTYLNLKGCTPEDIHQELSFLFIEIKRLAKLQKGSFEYTAILYDIKGRMRSFKNYFNQDVDLIIDDMCDVKTANNVMTINR